MRDLQRVLQRLAHHRRHLRRWRPRRPPAAGTAARAPCAIAVAVAQLAPPRSRPCPSTSNTPWRANVFRFMRSICHGAAARDRRPLARGPAPAPSASGTARPAPAASRRACRPRYACSCHRQRIAPSYGRADQPAVERLARSLGRLRVNHAHHVGQRRIGCRSRRRSSCRSLAVVQPLLAPAPSAREPSDLRPAAPCRRICTKVRSIRPLSTTRANTCAQQLRTRAPTAPPATAPACPSCGRAHAHRPPSWRRTPRSISRRELHAPRRAAPAAPA